MPRRPPNPSDQVETAEITDSAALFPDSTELLNVETRLFHDLRVESRLISPMSAYRVNAWVYTN